MPNQNLTEIAIILDRSGSMQRIQKDMEGGFSAFIAEQKKIPDPCVVSLYQFDDRFDVIYEEKPLAEVPVLGLVPRGSTALNDAVGRAIALIGERLARKDEADRPGKVIVLIITDGYENASREITRSQLADSIKHQREVYNWQFAFLAANIDSFAESKSLGVAANSTMDFTADPIGVKHMYAATSRGVGEYRKIKSADASLQVGNKEKK